ncbi:MAG TPA: hypothetical protein VME41_02360 [Stellaceae bacterium]|nr:hypothetical protein [Stellaceae bacterium]
MKPAGLRIVLAASVAVAAASPLPTAYAGGLPGIVGAANVARGIGAGRGGTDEDVPNGAGDVGAGVGNGWGHTHQGFGYGPGKLDGAIRSTTRSVMGPR